MVHFMDDELGKVEQVLKQTGIWDDALIVFHSDNGGEIKFAGICGGNNWPLRGGKFSNFEGGIRVNAFVTGGAIDPSLYGTKLDGYVTGWDWYSTYAAVAGVDPTDHQAAQAGLPPHDSINQLPMLTGENLTAPRTSLYIGDTSALTPNGDGKALVGGLIEGDYKLLLGAQNKMFMVQQNTRTGPLWPNSTVLVPSLFQKVCGRDVEHGCLFNIKNDETETQNLAQTLPEVFKSMLDKVDAMQQSVYSPNRGGKNGGACKAAKSKYHGYWGPWLDVNN